MSAGETVALVTGGRGFIGRSTCAALRARGVRAVATDIAGSGDADDPDVRVLDVCDGDAVREVFAAVRPQIVIHLAARLGIDTDDNPRQGMDANVNGAQNIFDACVEFGVSRLVYGSSIAVYGDQTPWDDHTVTENDLGRPTILYGWHKMLNEATARHYARLHGLSAVGLRISTVYGEGRKHGMSAPINLLIEGAAAGRGECIYGPKTDSCLIHVDDVAEQLAILATAESPGHDLYNAGGDYSTIGEMTEWIREMRPDATIVLGAPEARIPHVSRVDGSRFIEEFGFTPRSFESFVRAAMSEPATADR